MKFITQVIAIKYRAFLICVVGVVRSGCISVKNESKTPTLLKTEDATQAELMNEVNRFARVNSMRAKMDLKFEDNSFAEFGSKEVYRSADGEVVVQRPGKILLKVQVPVIKTDVAQMTSDGETFRVAILQDGGTRQIQEIRKGHEQRRLFEAAERPRARPNSRTAKAVKENVNAFANLRPQHFTDAMLVRPTDADNVYTQSTIFQIEEDETSTRNRRSKGDARLLSARRIRKARRRRLTITRRFWFDRVGGIRLARQQIFDAKGEIESDIVYGKEGNLTDTAITPTCRSRYRSRGRKEKYSMRLTYQTPEAVTIGKKYPGRGVRPAEHVESRRGRSRQKAAGSDGRRTAVGSHDQNTGAHAISVSLLDETDPSRPMILKNPTRSESWKCRPLRGVSLEVEEGRVRRDHGAVGLRQIDAAASARRTAEPDQRQHPDRRRRPGESFRRTADRHPPAQDRLCFSAVQPFSDAFGRGQSEARRKDPYRQRQRELPTAGAKCCGF